MNKKHKLLLLLLLSYVVILALCSCQNIFGTSTDVNNVYGDWVYLKDSGFEIRLSLNRDGTYYYEEIASYGKTLYENKGKFSLGSTRLTLKNLDTADGDRHSSFSISMKKSDDGEDIMELVPTLMRKYTFKRVGSFNNTNAVVTIKSKTETQIKLDIEGSWYSASIGRIDINGNKIEVTPESMTSFVLTISEVNGNTIKLDTSDYGLDEYGDASYFIVNGSLYVVFPKLSGEAIIFTAIK